MLTLIRTVFFIFGAVILCKLALNKDNQQIILFNTFLFIAHLNLHFFNQQIIQKAKYLEHISILSQRKSLEWPPTLSTFYLYYLQILKQSTP